MVLQLLQPLLKKNALMMLLPLLLPLPLKLLEILFLMLMNVGKSDLMIGMKKRPGRTRLQLRLQLLQRRYMPH
jgi:hypothetical protein